METKEQTMELFKKIRKAAILLNNTDFYYPLTDQVVSFDNSWITRGYQEKYCISEDKKRIAFIDKNKRWYVIPLTKTVLDILKSSGYRNASFFVPGELNSYPLHRKIYWNNLLKEADC